MRLVLSLLLLSLCSPGTAGTVFILRPWTVGNTPGVCHFTTIQAAIDAAAAAPGEQTIRITDDFAYDDQTLTIVDTETVTLEGGYAACDSEAPTLEAVGIAGNASNSVLRVMGTGDVELRNLVLGGGHGTPRDGGERHGGGIFHGGSGLLTLRATRVAVNQASYGSGIAVEGSGALRLIGSEVSMNRRGALVRPAIAGIYFDSDGSLSIEADSELSNNESNGLYVLRAASTTVADSRIWNNNGTNDRGHGVQLFEAGHVALTDIEISENLAGGLHHEGEDALVVERATIERNGPHEPATQGGEGGIVLRGGGTTRIRDSLIQHNRAGMTLSGGGIAYLGSGRLELESTTIFDNVAAAHGGGIHVEADGSGPTPALVFGSDVRIEGNYAGMQTPLSGSGGGVHLVQAHLLAANAPWHVISSNFATGYGGGLYMSGGVARIGSGAADGNIIGNSAQLGGGGIAIDNDAYLTLFTTRPETPAGVVDNEVLDTAGHGGGLLIGVGSSAHAFGFDVMIDHNHAGMGAGIAVMGADSELCLGRVHDPASCSDFEISFPVESRPCSAGLRCNSLRFNVASHGVGGAALLRTTYGGDSPTRVRIVGAYIANNQGYSILSSIPVDGVFTQPLEVTDSLMAYNTAAHALFDGIPEGYGNTHPSAQHLLGPVVVARSTLAQNSLGANAVINTRSGLTLTESIVYQEGTTVHAGNASGVTARHVLAHEVASLPQRADVIAGDPRFVHPEELYPGPGSPALDFSNYVSGGVDLDGVTRTQDLPNVINRFGIRDLGAFEAPDPTTFRDGFEAQLP